MGRITIDFNLEDFEIESIDESERTIDVYGHTTETSVPCSACGKKTSHFHGYDDERQVRHLTIMMLDVNYLDRLTTTILAGFAYPGFILFSSAN